MSISLERYSLLRSPKQAHDLNRLWGPTNREPANDTERRYRDLPHALHNVIRLATAAGYESYIIRRERAAIGTASIIFDAAVRNSAGTAYAANNLDYRFAQEQSDEDHDQAALALIHESARRALGRSGSSTTHHLPGQPLTSADNPIMVTTPVEDPYNRGFHAHMNAIGEPDIYSDDPASAIPEVGEEGVSMQLYTATYHASLLIPGGVRVERVV